MNTKIKLKLGRAFTSDGLRPGNPALLVEGMGPPRDQKMIALTKQYDVNNSIYVDRGNPEALRATYYSRSCRVSLCGHASLFAASVLIDPKIEQRLTLLTEVGPIELFYNGTYSSMKLPRLDSDIYE